MRIYPFGSSPCFLSWTNVSSMARKRASLISRAFRVGAHINRSPRKAAAISASHTIVSPQSFLQRARQYFVPFGLSFPIRTIFPFSSSCFGFFILLTYLLPVTAMWLDEFDCSYLAGQNER